MYRVSAMPTFIFLKGSTKVDQVRGADKARLESALQRHSGAPSPGGGNAFSGRGQTLGGSSAPADLSRDATATLNKAASKFTNLDSQFQVFLALVGAYALFWYLSR